MKPKTLILLVVAVGCGLVASYMTSKLLAEKKAAVPEERVDVVVAKTKVPRFTRLTDPEKYFEVRSRLKSEAPHTYISDLKDIKDKRVNKEFKPDAHIEPEDVQDKVASALPTPEGYGAIAIRVNAATAVGYFVGPGDKVDIILTQRGDNAFASTILRDVLVLAAGDRIVRSEGSGDTGAVIQAQTVSVALKNEDAQLVRLAEAEGELSLLLRNNTDKSEPGTSKLITREDLKRAGRGTNVAGVTPPTLPPVTTPPTTTPPETKLPFGWTLEEIKKGEKKVDDEETPKPILPAWTVTIEAGAAPPVKVPYWQNTDGTFSREALPPALPKKDEKKDEKKTEKK